jgi:outer membrane beta-barrel protein
MRIWAAVWFLCLVPCVALAQEGGLGLDLNEEKKETPPAETTPAAESAPTSPTDTPAEPKPTAEPLFSERDITQEDRVKSVQRKLYLKRHRFEVSPSLFTSVNDPYYSKSGFGLRGAFYLADTLALAVRGSLLTVLPTEDVRTAKRTFQSRIFYSVPQLAAMADLEWSPIYGKVSAFNSIVHFDAFVLGGLGAVGTETAPFPGRPGAELGGGIRFQLRDWLSVHAAVIDTVYVDTPAGTTKSATQNMVTLNIGVSLFIPFSSTGKEAE